MSNELKKLFIFVPTMLVAGISLISLAFFVKVKASLLVNIIMLATSLVTLGINIIMLYFAIEGIIIPIRQQKKQEREQSDKAINVLNTAIADRNFLLNFDRGFICHENDKIRPLKDENFKTFVIENSESLVNIVIYLNNIHIDKKIRKLREEYKDFMYRNFNTLKSKDIDKIIKKIQDIDKLIASTDYMFEWFPKRVRASDCPKKVERYLCNELKENFEGEKPDCRKYWIINSLTIFADLKNYKDEIAEVHNKL